MYDQKTGSPTRKAVLGVLANWADEQWSCYPQIEKIVAATELKERAVQQALKDLCQLGFIRIFYRYKIGGSRRSSRYQLLYDGGATPLPEAADWSSWKGAGDGSDEPGPEGIPAPDAPPIPAPDAPHTRSRCTPYPQQVRVTPLIGSYTTQDTTSDTSAAPAAKTKGTRIPEGFQPDEAMRAWFVERGLGRYIDGLEVHRDFVDYWQARPGREALKLDWAATWRRWMRTAAEKRGWVPPSEPGNSLALVKGATNGAQIPAGAFSGPTGTAAKVAGWLDLAEQFAREETQAS